MTNRKWIWILIISLLFSISAQSQSRSKSSNDPKCEPFIYERLRNYLDLNEFKPFQTITNPDGPQWKVGVKKFQLGKYTVEWTNKDEGKSLRSSIRINGEPVSLDGVRTINFPEGAGRFGFELVDQWDEIKLYELEDQEIIAISMRPSVCSGLSCSVGVQLWYGLKSRRSTLFGTFRTDSEPRLFNWPGGGDLYVLGSTYTGDLHGAEGPIVWRYEFYKLLPDARFEVQKDKSGKPYFLKHTSYPDLIQVNGKWVRNPDLPIDTLEQNWIENVLNL